VKRQTSNVKRQTLAVGGQSTERINNSLKPLRIGFVPIARPTFDAALAADITARARWQLHAAGCELSGPVGLAMDLAATQAAATDLADKPLDLLVVFQATFADSTMVMELARTMDAPLLLWAVPEERTGGRLRLNSLCGINLAGHGLTRAGLRYDYVYAAAEDPAAVAKVLTIARAGRARRLLKAARIGRVGEHPTGFEPCSFDRDALGRRFGVQVAAVDLHDVFDRVRATPAAEAAVVQARLSRRVDGLETLDQPALQGTLSAYVTLRRLAEEQNLQGLAIRCWPEFFTELGCAACGAMSMLTDELTPCSCEADVNGTITQLMLQWLSGEQAFGTDVVGFDLAADNAVVWHCGQAPLSMADRASHPRATIHSNRKLPLLMEFPLKPGRVTLARLTEAKRGASVGSLRAESGMGFAGRSEAIPPMQEIASSHPSTAPAQHQQAPLRTLLTMTPQPSRGEYTLVVGAGEMLRAPLSFSGTSGVLRFDRPAAEVLDTIMTNGLDHHISLTYGDYVAELLALAKMLELPVLRLA